MSSPLTNTAKPVTVGVERDPDRKTERWLVTVGDNGTAITIGRFDGARAEIHAKSLARDIGFTLGHGIANVDIGGPALRVPIGGLDICECGCKYWENSRCVDCGDIFDGVPA